MSINEDIAALKDEYSVLTERELSLWTAILEAKRAELAKVKQIHQSLVTSSPAQAAIPAAPPSPLFTPVPSGTAPVPPAPVTPPMPAPAATAASAPPEEHRAPAPPAPVIPAAPQAAPAPPQGAAPPPAPAPPQLAPPPPMPTGNAGAMDLIRQLTS